MYRASVISEVSASEVPYKIRVIETPVHRDKYTFESKGGMLSMVKPSIGQHLFYTLSYVFLLC